MAYDLLYKKQVPLNCGRYPGAGAEINGRTAALLAAGLAAAVHGSFAKVRREGEKQYYQRELRPGHHPTVEVPTMPMGEMMRFGDGRYQT